MAAKANLSSQLAALPAIHALVIGAGTVSRACVGVLRQLGAVTVMDVNIGVLRMIGQQFHESVDTMISNHCQPDEKSCRRSMSFTIVSVGRKMRKNSRSTASGGFHGKGLGHRRYQQ